VATYLGVAGTDRAHVIVYAWKIRMLFSKDEITSDYNLDSEQLQKVMIHVMCHEMGHYMVKRRGIGQDVQHCTTQTAEDPDICVMTRYGNSPVNGVFSKNWPTFFCNTHAKDIREYLGYE
jgi:hypothetical protein